MKPKLNDMHNTNLSRRQLLRQLGSAAVALPALTISSCNQGRKKVAFYGTGTLDIERPGWDRLTKDAGIELSFTDNQNDTGPVIAKMITGTASSDFDLGGLQ